MAAIFGAEFLVVWVEKLTVGAKSYELIGPM